MIQSDTNILSCHDTFWVDNDGFWYICHSDHISTAKTMTHNPNGVGGVKTTKKLEWNGMEVLLSVNWAFFKIAEDRFAVKARNVCQQGKAHRHRVRELLLDTSSSYGMGKFPMPAGNKSQLVEVKLCLPMHMGLFAYIKQTGLNFR